MQILLHHAPYINAPDPQHFLPSSSCHAVLHGLTSNTAATQQISSTSKRRSAHAYGFRCPAKSRRQRGFSQHPAPYWRATLTSLNLFT